MSADKPAATGSGEPKLPEGADDPELFRKQRDWLLIECERLGITVNVAIGEDIRKAYRLSLPTPPASQPAVTLDKETFDKACELAQEVRDHSTTFDIDEFPSLGRELLTLLRAAETRKP